MLKLAALALCLPAAAGAATATLKEAAAVNGPNITAQDVVQEDLGGAGSVVLKPLGRPGSAALVGSDLVKSKLARAQGGPWMVQGTACRVSATSQKVLGADIQGFARQWLEERLRALSQGAKAEIKPGSPPQDLLLSGALLKMQVDGQVRTQMRGNVIVRVRLLQEAKSGAERESASVPVSFAVSQNRQVVVALRTLRRGDLLDAASLELKDADLTYVQGEALGSLADVQGLRSRAQIQAGRVITRDLIEQPPAVKRGDIVRLISRVGAVSVETGAKALRDAPLGGSLPLEVEGSKKQVQGRVVEPGVVLKD